MFRRIPPRPTRRTRFPAQKKDESGARRAAFDVAVRYYRKGLISIEKAAEDAGMRWKDFAALAAQNKLV